MGGAIRTESGYMKFYKPWPDMLYATRKSDWDIWYHYLDPHMLVDNPPWCKSLATDMTEILLRPERCQTTFEELTPQEQVWALELALTE